MPAFWPGAGLPTSGRRSAVAAPAELRCGAAHSTLMVSLSRLPKSACSASGLAAPHHVAGRLSAADRSRARGRLLTEGLLALVPRLGRRAIVRRFAGTGDAIAALAQDARILLAGVSAAEAHGWAMPDVSGRRAARPTIDGYLSELRLADITERYEPEPDDAGTIVLRAVREPWPFPAQLRLAPALVAALDLAESSLPVLAEIGRAWLAELAETVEPTWHQRHSPKPPLRSLLAGAPDGEAPAPTVTTRRLTLAGSDGEVWDDRAVADIKYPVALLFVAAGPLTRTELSRRRGIGPTRLARACALARPLLGRLGLSTRHACFTRSNSAAARGRLRWRCEDADARLPHTGASPAQYMWRQQAAMEREALERACFRCRGMAVGWAGRGQIRGASLGPDPSTGAAPRPAWRVG
jgi:hypothetical protein